MLDKVSIFLVIGARGEYSEDYTKLRRHLPLLVDVAKEGNVGVHKVTSIRTICEAMNANPTYKLILSEVHKLLRLYLVVPITSATAERTFSVLKRLLTYLRSEKRLALHAHKDLTDELNLMDIAKEFISVNIERNRHFGSLYLNIINEFSQLEHKNHCMNKGFI